MSEPSQEATIARLDIINWLCADDDKVLQEDHDHVQKVIEKAIDAVITEKDKCIAELEVELKAAQHNWILWGNRHTESEAACEQNIKHITILEDLLNNHYSGWRKPK